MSVSPLDTQSVTVSFSVDKAKRLVGQSASWPASQSAISSQLISPLVYLQQPISLGIRPVKLAVQSFIRKARARQVFRMADSKSGGGLEIAIG